MHPIPPCVKYESFDFVYICLQNTYDCIMTLPRNIVCKTQQIAAICHFA